MAGWVLDEQCAAYDAMRKRCPVAFSQTLGWSLFRHADVRYALNHPELFSNRVSERRSVPNGMDPPEHTAYRHALEPFFSEERMNAYEPHCRALAQRLLRALPSGVDVDFMAGFAVPFALRCQCAFLGWPEDMAEPIRLWVQKNREVTLAGHRAAQVAVAEEFREHVSELLRERRGRQGGPGNDVTANLMQLEVKGQRLSNEELISIFRNWTVGEVGSLAASAGIVAHALATLPRLQERARKEPAVIPDVVEEVLRNCGPLLFNRRVTRKEVQFGDVVIPAGERVALMWVAANRDEQAFERPEDIRVERPKDDNLLFGAGIHICPGAPLARLELRVAVETLLSRFRRIELAKGAVQRRATYPSNGWDILTLRGA